MTTRDVVVGVDGSGESDAALRWAAHEAQRREAELTVLHAYEPGQAEIRTPLPATHERDLRQMADAVVDNAVAEVRSLTPTLEVRGEAVTGAAAACLLAAAKEAAMVVVGSRGRGGFAGLLLGSVSEHVATHSNGPVAVVRNGAERLDYPVVVGVDEGGESDHAMALAFEEAALRGASIVALHAYSPAVRTGALHIPPTVEGEHARQITEPDWLAAMIAPMRKTFPEVQTEVVVVEGQAAAQLVNASVTAQLVVVGSRGRGGFASLLLGSVGLQTLHHASCPVLIARHSAHGSIGS